MNKQTLGSSPAASAIAMAIGALLFSSFASAATINVTTNAEDVLAVNGQCSLREAITNINKGFDYHSDCKAINVPSPYGTSDTINLPAGTYKTSIANPTGTPAWGEDLNATGDYDILKSVAFVGAGAATTIIDGNGTTIKDRVFDIDPALTGHVEVSFSGVTITNGNCYAEGCYGGGIKKNGGGLTQNGSVHYPNPLTITDSIISNNKTSSGPGGGIYNNGYSYGAVDVMTITNSTISNNTAGGGFAGGGIASSFGKLIITDSTITGNTATLSGGGIYNYSDLTITTSTISNNTAADGGGIHNDNNYTYTYGTLTLTDSTVSGNKATATGTGRGGGIKNGVTLNVIRSIINDNTASFGGGIDSSVYGVVAVTNTTITGNTALYGGAVFSNGTYGATNFVISNATITNNTGTNYVGGINCNYGIKLSNTILAKQKSGIDCSASCQIVSTGNNLQGGTACYLTGSGDKQNVNPLLGSLADNGGPTKTIALLAGSPAIDAGSCEQTTDQAGTKRPQGAGCDIGAYEGAASSAVSSTDCLFNWAEDKYPTLFKPSRPTTETFGDYTLRRYATTSTYLGISSGNGRLYYFAPKSSSNAMLDLGLVTTWKTQAGCSN